MQPSRRIPGHGGNLTWAASLAGCSPSEILDFSASINPLGPPQSAIVAIQSSLRDLCHYPDPGYTSLRQALAATHGLSPDWVLPGNGSAELLTWASRELAELNATHLLTPAFGDYLRALRAFDAKIVPCPIVLPSSSEPSKSGKAFLLKIQNEQQTSPLPPTPSSPLPLTPSLPHSSTGLLLNNPHNPTGQLFDQQSLLPLLEHYALVVVDEAFMDFLPPDEQQSLIDRITDFPNLVILRSLTKFYSFPGLRFGYVIAHPDRLDRWQQWRDPWSVNTLAAVAAEAVVTDVAFQQQTLDWLPIARNQLYRGLADLPGLSPLPGAANFLLVWFQGSTIELQRQLLQQHRILIRDCTSFPELGDRFFRVAVRTESENRRLLDALAQVLPHSI
ncbi:threonine-phosphate decarboxylase CobD [Leptolyngbya sp. FACHB-711]|uniref:threonine-phosphate decarboxylase CobD n=1 Tax=unclassified Leptolyngbya TaxID=2650499 RepID=UPI0016840658|nr:threonine-phosphate decarboxylase [Cyanobacteria bacterium FACHB-502]MBD2024716.1 threonine-phosphate decarboxylase [Leptolyngbya sp. FACHB-711]